MVRKKLDGRIRNLIENCVKGGHRGLIGVMGPKSRDQVVLLHHMLSKATVSARPSVLWCYKKELGFTTHRKKRMKMIKKKIKAGTLDPNKDDPFELFVSATNIRYMYYNESHNVLGNTYGMCVLQDFEALTPNLLARTIETVNGGGLVIMLLHSLSDIRQLHTMTMDCHDRYRTEAHQDITCRFNERFLLSLTDAKNCLMLTDELDVIPLSSNMTNIAALPSKTKEESLTAKEAELVTLKQSLVDTQPVGVVVEQCKTLDQAKAVLQFVDAISEKSLKSTVTLTAARGRGKSAALGLSISTAVAFGYSNIFVTSPSPENLNTLFEFIFKGFDVLQYTEHTDYEIIQSTNPAFNKAVVRVNIFRDHRQTIQYIAPGDCNKLGQAELVVIDEAAAIPLPLVKNLLGPYLVFLASTINGYEGTGRSLSLKLIDQLRKQSATTGGTGVTSRVLNEMKLEEPIRYKDNDPIEGWLHQLLCLDSTKVHRIMSGCPAPKDCNLFYVNRDTLFSYHKASETFLQRLMSLYVASHYKNSPNDLQLLSDAPAHHLFCLLGPVDQNSGGLPEVLCVLQVCLEGAISKETVQAQLSRGQRAAGDLIPWTISQQFQDDNFASLSGARVVRIATHSDFQGMGYGRRALDLLKLYYNGEVAGLDEGQSEEPAVEKEAESGPLKPRKNLPPLLTELADRPAERLDYLGVSYGLTAQLFKFWKRCEFVPVYLRQTANDLTGEHTCIMIATLSNSQHPHEWLGMFSKDFKKRMLNLLGYQFRSFTPQMVSNLIASKLTDRIELTQESVSRTFSQYDIKRLSLYSKNLVDYHLIMDLVPLLARMYFSNAINITLSPVQTAILLGLGLQFRTVDELQPHLAPLEVGQILGLFNKIIRKFVQNIEALKTNEIEAGLSAVTPADLAMNPLANSLKQDLEQAAVEIKEKQKTDLKRLQMEDLSEFQISGSDAQWTDVMNNVTVGNNSVISMKRKVTPLDPADLSEEKKKKKKKAPLSSNGVENGIEKKKKKKHKAAA